MSIPGLSLNETDDEFFGTLESRSNLDSLFAVNQPNVDANQSLKYKPPKAVEGFVNDVAGGAQTSAWSVQVARVVSAFKLVNQENVSQGRVGLALLKNSNNDFKIIVYRTKSNVLSTTTLQTGTKLFLISSYFQFRDDLQEFWSIFLETSEERSFIDHLPAGFLSLNKAEKSEAPVIVKYSNPDQTPDDSDVTEKAKIVSRMAKMGQPLPKLAAAQLATTDFSDSSDTEVINIPPKPIIMPRKVTKQLVPVSNSLQTSSVVAYGPQVQESQYVNMLLTENRTQNTELRMNLSKLETKIERVLDKIELIGSKDSPESKDRDDEILELEEKILELRKENRSLRQSVKEAQAKKIDSTRNQSKVKSKMFSGFESTLDDLGINLNDYEQLDDLTLNILENSRTLVNELRLDCKAKDNQLATARSGMESLNSQCADLKANAKDAEEHKRRAESLLKEREDLKQQLDSVKADTDNGAHKLQEMVKHIMNNLYGSIVASLENTSEPLSKEMILQICGNAIRKETINAIQTNKN